MLILSRKLNESIIIDGQIVVKVLRIDKDTVKLGVQAPTEIPVHREEIHEAILKSKQAAAAGPGESAGATPPTPATPVAPAMPPPANNPEPTQPR
jgi:carbon storage regulator